MSVKHDFLAWAKLSAQLLRKGYAERARLLSEHGVAAEWFAADTHWFEVLVSDIDAGRLDRVETYAQMCRAAVEGQPLENQPLPPALKRGFPPIGLPVYQPGQATAPVPDPASPAATPATPARHIPEPTRQLPAALADEEEATMIEAPRVTLEQYASIRAEILKRPHEAQAVWAGRGIHSDAVAAAIERTWAQRLASDPELEQKLDELVQLYTSQRS